MTQLYRFFDSDGRLLYVGVSLNLISRLRTHETDSHWFNRAKTVTIETLNSEDEAFDAEAVAIQTEHPLHNIVVPSQRPKTKDQVAAPAKGTDWLGIPFPPD